MQKLVGSGNSSAGNSCLEGRCRYSPVLQEGRAGHRQQTQRFLASSLERNIAAARKNLAGSSGPCRLIPKPGETPLLSQVKKGKMETRDIFVLVD